MLKRSVSISNTPGCRFPHESHHLVSHCICLFQSRCLRWYIQASLVAYSLACTVHYAHFSVTAELKSVNAGCETLCRGRHCAKEEVCVRCAGAGRWERCAGVCCGICGESWGDCESSWGPSRDPGESRGEQVSSRGREREGCRK